LAFWLKWQVEKPNFVVLERQQVSEVFNKKSSQDLRARGVAPSFNNTPFQD
jgi:hypothetical protein